MSESQSDSAAIAASLLDPGAFGVIFERHYDAVHGYLQRRLDDARADEIASQTFLLAFDGRDRFDRSRADARPWLFGIATNLAHNHRRHELVELRAMAAMRPEVGAAVEGVEARAPAPRPSPHHPPSSARRLRRGDGACRGPRRRPRLQLRADRPTRERR